MHVSLIDRILSLEAGREIRAAKNLSYREDFLGDHFASFPLMPGALQVEAMVQMAQWMLRVAEGFPEADFMPCVFSNTRYARYVRPGDQIVFTVTLQKNVTPEQGDRWKFKGTGEVDGQRACQAQFELVRYEQGWQGVSAEARADLLRLQRDTLARLQRVPVRYSTNIEAAIQMGRTA
jgi:3-hydroxyacyl-[acyl-carrier-protein] dehydratase